MKITPHIFIVCSVLFLNVLLADAQSDTTKMQVEKMTIIGTVEPVIEQKKKPEINPDIKNETIDFPVPNYPTDDVQSLPAKNEQKPVAFQPLPKHQMEDGSELRNYLILGFANYITPLAEFYANMQANRKHAFGLHLKHLSSQGGINDYANNSFSHNNIDAFYKYMGSNFILKTDLYFDRDVVHYYGFKPKELEEAGISFPTDDDSIKQRYALIGGKIGFSNNTAKPTDFQYFTNLEFSNFSDRYKNRENDFSINVALKKGFDWFRFSDYQTLGVLLDFKYYDQLTSFYDNGFINLQPRGTLFEYRQKDWKLDFHPYIGAEWDEYYVNIGANLSLTHSDSGTVFHIHPAIEGKIKVVSEKLDVFMGLGGAIERHSMKSLTDENPFIMPSALFVAGNDVFQNNKIKIYGGLNLNVLEGWDLKLGASYSYIDNMAIFTLSGDSSRVVPVYQPFFANTNELNVYLKTNYSFSDKVRANLVMDFYSYSSKEFSHAYYKPAFKLLLSGEYRPIKNLKLGIDFNFYSKMWANENKYVDNQQTETETDNDIQLPCLYDLSLKGEYKVWKELYLFLNINNLLAQNYERYLYYPTQGVTFMIGGKFRF